ncbi:MAG: PD-(D/E)XK nuclease family protein, partial [Candidatus Methanomethylophilaceae archaeon]|nr:PD-(D/E)XK nuclease family protein [Candidatus Methanomethylophilaceae archaeon]
IRSMTFDEVRERLCDKRARIQVGIVITDLGIAGRKITSELVSQLNYAVDNISDLRHNEEIPPDEKRGVLIADCKRSVYVDRPLVFFLNMDHDWDINTAGKRYIDSEAETEKNAMKITAMLQQGERRVYVVNSSKNGKKARPALIFDTVFGRSVSGFRDICGKIVPGRWYNPEPEARYSRGEDRLGSAEEIIEGFSKTGFNAYFSCPRMFFFYKILRTPEEKDAEFGSLIHEFAQFYICYPEIVRSEGIGKLIDAVSDRYSGLSTPLMKDLDRDRIACAMKNVTRYIDSRIKAEVPLDRVPDPEHENRFFKMYGLERGSSVCESPCVSRTRILYGIFDAVTDTAVLDYKTGKARSAKHICDSMSLSRPARYPEFQPVIYSALANEGAGHRDLELFYALDNDAESVSGDYDIERSVRTVRIVDGDINSVIRENEILRMKLEKTLSIKFKENIPGFLKTISECDLDPDPASWDSNSEVIAAVLRFSGLKDGKTNREAVRRAVRKVAKAVSGGMIYDDRRINILTENIDDFYRAAEEMHRDAQKYALSEFPAEPRIRCRDCRFFASCTAEISDSDDTEEDL